MFHSSLYDKFCLKCIFICIFTLILIYNINSLLEDFVAKVLAHVTNI